MSRHALLLSPEQVTDEWSAAIKQASVEQRTDVQVFADRLLAAQMRKIADDLDATRDMLRDSTDTRIIHALDTQQAIAMNLRAAAGSVDK
jgi:hypothetical protein